MPQADNPDGAGDRARAISMEQLFQLWRRARGRVVVVDVRTAKEFGEGHVPASRNIPLDVIRRRPSEIAAQLARLGHVYIHCGAGPRAEKAYYALCAEGATNLTVIVESGMREWLEHGYPVASGWRANRPTARDLLIGIGAGIVASVVIAVLDRTLRQRLGVTARHRSTHDTAAAARIGEAIIDRALGKHRGASSDRTALVAFHAAYAAGWGLLYAVTRSRRPELYRWAGLPFGALSYVRDGVMAPMLELGPTPARLPVEANAGNSMEWTITAEMVRRSAKRLAR